MWQQPNWDFTVPRLLNGARRTDGKNELDRKKNARNNRQVAQMKFIQNKSSMIQKPKTEAMMM
jgi:hypothetical protein